MSDQREPLDHEHALSMAELKHASNLARCYADLHRQHETLQGLYRAKKAELEDAERRIQQLEKEREYMEGKDGINV